MQERVAGADQPIEPRLAQAHGGEIVGALLRGQHRDLRLDLGRDHNGGRTFRLLSTFSALDLKVDPATPATLYAAAGPSGVFRSTDGGATWTPVNAGLARYASPPWNASELALDPAVPHRVFAVVGGWIFENRVTAP